MIAPYPDPGVTCDPTAPSAECLTSGVGRDGLRDNAKRSNKHPPTLLLGSLHEPEVSVQHGDHESHRYTDAEQLRLTIPGHDLPEEAY